MRIRVISPVAKEENERLDLGALRKAARADNELDKVYIDEGPASIEGEFDEALAVPGVIAKACEAEEEGVDAIVINCMAEPGIRAVREAVNIPVVGPGEASMHIAAMLGHKFSIIAALDRSIHSFERQCGTYGLGGMLASVRAINIPVLQLIALDQERSVEAITDAAIQAIDEDGAHIIILGCTGMTGLGEVVAKRLIEKGYQIPVIDPLIAALKLAEALVDMGLSHSKLTFPRPLEKERTGYENLPTWK